MEHENVMLAKTYLKLAEADLKSSKKEIEIGNYHTSVYFSSQVAEKSLKSVLFLLGYRIYEHKVASEFVAHVVATEEEKYSQELRKIAMASLQLEEHWLKSKYPIKEGKRIISPTERYSKGDAEKFYKLALKIFEGVKEYLNRKYGITVD